MSNNFATAVGIRMGLARKKEQEELLKNKRGLTKESMEALYETDENHRNYKKNEKANEAKVNNMINNLNMNIVHKKTKEEEALKNKRGLYKIEPLEYETDEQYKKALELYEKEEKSRIRIKKTEIIGEEKKILNREIEQLKKEGQFDFVEAKKEKIKEINAELVSTGEESKDSKKTDSTNSKNKKKKKKDEKEVGDELIADEPEKDDDGNEYNINPKLLSKTAHINPNVHAGELILKHSKNIMKHYVPTVAHEPIEDIYKIAYHQLYAPEIARQKLMQAVANIDPEKINKEKNKKWIYSGIKTALLAGGLGGVGMMFGAPLYLPSMLFQALASRYVHNHIFT